MANPEHLEILSQGARVWNRWRYEHPEVRPNLSEANLAGADLRETDLFEANLTDAYLNDANLIEANLSRANLRMASLDGAYLTDADLSDANLVGAYLNRADLFEVNLPGADLLDANLVGANLSGANLVDANLRATNLVRANLNGANLIRADLSEAQVGATVFGEVDLREVIGLENVLHATPSTVGLDTIAKSKGQIPEVFLRGCGLSDLDIEYAKLHRPDLSMEQVTDVTYRIAELRGDSAIQFHSCFISHATGDIKFVQKLYDDLQDNGVRCWFAPEDLKIGDEIRPTIDQAIMLHDKLMIVLSENSIDSNWVEDEVEAAYERENEESRTILFPLRIDDAVTNTRESWAAKIRRQRHIGDFSDWKDHDAYQEAFDRLMRDLEASERER